MTEVLEDQVERTLLSWRRTALSMLAAGLLVGHLAGLVALAVVLLGISVVVAFVWLGHAHSTAASGVALVFGVLLLGAVALIEVAAR